MAGSRRAAILLLAVMAGCVAPAGSATVSIGEAATTHPTSTSTASSTGEPSTSPTPGELPPVPSGFPVMDGMQPLGPDEPDVIAEWRTEANGAQVHSFYQAALATAGYAIDLDAPGGAVAVFRFRPPAADQLQVDIYAEASGTTVQLRLPHP